MYFLVDYYVKYVVLLQRIGFQYIYFLSDIYYNGFLQVIKNILIYIMKFVFS